MENIYLTWILYVLYISHCKRCVPAIVVGSRNVSNRDPFLINSKNVTLNNELSESFVNSLKPIINMYNRESNPPFC